MTTDRRAALAALGTALPFGLAARAGAAPPAAPALRLRPFEEAVRAAFASDETTDCCRVEVGHCDAVQAGLPGCTNDRPFAGFPAGRLRIVRTGTAPGPAVAGVRLYVATVDVARTDAPGRPFDFASLPPAPVLDDAAPPTSRPQPGNARPAVRRS